MGPRVDNPRITKGLGSYQPDYYAALGVPFSASVDHISDAYKKIARSKSLRPGFLGQTTPEGQYASWLLARLINPAKELLLKENERIEYDATIKLQIRRLMEDKYRDPYPISPQCEALRNAADLETAYQAAVAKIASIQFEDLYSILSQAETLSELNLTYLLCRLYPSTKVSGTNRIPTPPATPIATTPPASTPPTSTPPTSPDTPPARPSLTGANRIPTPSNPLNPSTSQPITPTGANRVPPPSNPTLTPSETRFRQAVELAAKGDYKQAIQFFNLAISMDSNEPQYYFERAMAHERMGNRSNARSDLNKVLELNPKDKKAAKVLQDLERSPTAPLTPPPQQVQPRPATPPQGGKTTGSTTDKDKKQGGGFFGGLFGKK